MKHQINVPIIEITGVKGKTTTAAMLKEIYRLENPLILSSLGVAVVVDGEEFQLQKNISITPASIITAWNSAEKFFNEHKSFDKQGIDNIGICIFESSLGGTGLGDVGVITNIAEDYPIAQGNNSASKAKSQMFESRMLVGDHDSQKEIYSKNQDYKSLLANKVNTFSKTAKSAVKSLNVKYGLQKTTFEVEVTNLLTLTGDCINTSFALSTFAPAEYHLENTLCAITTALTMGTSTEAIIQGMTNFKGLPGRTSLRNYVPVTTPSENTILDKSSLIGNRVSSNHQEVKTSSNPSEVTIIEEINPGINVTAIKRAVAMIKDYVKPAIVLGGSYGITCEEIDEKSLMDFLVMLDEDIMLVLTGELGRSLKDKMEKESVYCSQIDQAVNLAVREGAKNILLIYRSNFADLSKR